MLKRNLPLRPWYRAGQIVSSLVAAMMIYVSAAVAQEPPVADSPRSEAHGATGGRDAAQGKNRSLADFQETVKDAEKLDGLFTLYRKKGKVYAEIQPGQLGETFLAPMAIARGLASAGTPLNFGDEWVLTFKRVDDNLQLIRKNIRYEAPAGTPLAKAVEQNYTDSILQTIPIIAEKPNRAVLIDLGEIFLRDFANLGLGSLDRSRTTWHKVKAFPKNLELQVECTYHPGFGQSAGQFGDSGVIDPRGVTVVLHYSLTKRPPSGYKPRYADYRVGYFISATKDFGSKDPSTMFRRRVNRWRLEKADPKAELSPPKKQIVWWVENTVPHEYRPAVEEGILEWNKAFEKIGFRNAIGVRWQNEGDEFDPEDINYCTFRWITTPSTFAMSGLRADPITGEMIDGDVIFDASWIRAWKDEYALLVGRPLPAADSSAPAPVRVGEIISPMMAARYGYGLPTPVPHLRGALSVDGPHGESYHLVPSTMSNLQMALGQRIAAGRLMSCQCAAGKQHEYTMAAIALAASSDDGDEQGDKGAKKEDSEPQLPDELIGQAIKEVVMHEVGHSLGLRHNFKASSIRSLKEISDPNVTSTKGMVGSVMDYNPLNIARRGQKQGDFAATTIGPYDYWAIEYAYKPIDGDEEKELAKIAARSPEPDLVFATDEDMYLSNDPLVNTYDLGDDPLAYAKDRLELAKELLEDLDEKIVRDGESWSRLRNGFSALLGQFGNAAYMASSYIGGQHVSRDAKGTENGRDPTVPVDPDKQREALKFLVDEFLANDQIQFSPSILRRLTGENWYDWGSNGISFGSDYDIYQRVLAIQSIGLNHCLNAAVLRRLQNQALMASSDEKPLQVEEVFRALTDAIWNPVTNDAGTSAAIMRRNVQREHLKRLCRIVLGDRPDLGSGQFSFVVFSGGSNYPADARSLALAHLGEIDERIGKSLADTSLDESTKAHLAECKDVIDKTRASQLQRAQP